MCWLSLSADKMIEPCLCLSRHPHASQTPCAFICDRVCAVAHATLTFITLLTLLSLTWVRDSILYDANILTDKCVRRCRRGWWMMVDGGWQVTGVAFLWWRVTGDARLLMHVVHVAQWMMDKLARVKTGRKKARVKLVQKARVKLESS